MRKHLGFTLSEILIFMTIVGVIAVLAFSIFSDFDKGVRYIYSNTYHALDRALFNASNFSESADPFETTTMGENGEPIPVSPVEGASRLCNMLTEYINTIENNCSNTPLVDDTGRNFGQPAFIAGNGVRFYLTQRMQGAGQNPTIFYLIYADINGDKNPNSMRYEPPIEQNGRRTVDPDIFAFAALDIGRICPLGPPEVDGRYMLTRINYQDSRTVQNPDGSQSEEEVNRYTRTSQPYYISKAEAWGYYSANNDVPDITIIEDVPYSYNGYIRNAINQDSEIYSFLNGEAFPRVPEGVTLRNVPVIDGGLGCRRLADDCEVIIDRYLY